MDTGDNVDRLRLLYHQMIMTIIMPISRQTYTLIVQQQQINIQRPTSLSSGHSDRLDPFCHIAGIHLKELYASIWLHGHFVALTFKLESFVL